MIFARKIYTTTMCEEEIEGNHNNPIKMTKFENLPEHLIHHIMNLLSPKDATKCSVLSKAFYSWWLSFPVLDFDWRIFSEEDDDSDDRFFSLISKTLQLRSPHINNPLQKLQLEYCKSFKVPSDPFPFQPVLDTLLNFAIEKKSKEIYFDIPRPGFMNVRYEALVDLFSLQPLTVLKLSGLKFPVPDPIIHCPNLKSLFIIFCKGLRTLTVSSLGVDKVEVMACPGLEVVRVPKAKNLFQFSLYGCDSATIPQQPRDFELFACESLKHMSLYDVKVSKYNLTEPVTESLHISYCDLPKNFRIHSKVKELKVKESYNLENLFLSTPNLERFCFSYSYGHYPRQRCGMNISACVALTVVELNGVAIADEWLKSVISDLGSLKELRICSCGDLEKMDLKHEKLQILSLRKCCDLKEAIIDAPNLLKFEYEGSTQVYPLAILSTNKRCSANIVLLQCRINPVLWFVNLNRFLSCFHHIQHIAITFPRAKDFIFPIEHLSEKNPFPLRQSKYIKVQTRDKPDSETVMKMIEVLLWLVPKPLQLMLSMRYEDYEYLIGTLKFEYGKEAKKRKVEEIFCFGVPTKCWRHYELEVDIQGFDISENRGLIKKFFTPYMR